MFLRGLSIRAHLRAENELRKLYAHAQQALHRYHCKGRWMKIARCSIRVVDKVQMLVCYPLTRCKRSSEGDFIESILFIQKRNTHILLCAAPPHALLSLYQRAGAIMTRKTTHKHKPGLWALLSPHLAHAGDPSIRGTRWHQSHGASQSPARARLRARWTAAWCHPRGPG